MPRHELLLYYSPTCGYCARVLRFLQESGITITMKNVKASSQTHEEFRRASGGSQVPCLMVDGKPMLESLDIIDWLKENLTKDDGR